MSTTLLTRETTSLQTIIDNEHTKKNLSREELIVEILENKEAIPTKTGALATWGAPHSTGRIPKDTYIVRDDATESLMDWSSPAGNPMTPETFDMLWEDALNVLEDSEQRYHIERSAIHDPAHTLAVTVTSTHALSCLFTDNMFAEAQNLSESIFGDEPMQMIALPHTMLDCEKYRGRLREENGDVIPYVVAIDVERRRGVVFGSSYNGTIKKSVFTALNALTPRKGILPLHTSANMNSKGASALFLGLSGTGKTTVCNDGVRGVIADDELIWSDTGIANLEDGIFAKLVNLSEEKEPSIYESVFSERPVLENGVIIENTMTYPDGTVDVFDSRLTENSRASYPLSFSKHALLPARASHPETIIFLTADAHGVLPPLAKLTNESALFWFLMGYTCKLAGTEAGINTPKTVFSRFFGAPFMPCQPMTYLDLFKKKIEKHQTQVFLINTGWTGGAYGTGERISITNTRAMVDAALNRTLNEETHRFDDRWKLFVPTECPGVDATLLNPKSTWEDPQAFETAANTLAEEFESTFQKNFAGAVSEEIAQCCPCRTSDLPVRQAGFE